MAFLRYGKINTMLREGATLLGRAAYCDISFDDGEVSKEHALLLGSDDGWSLVDLKSTNGTYVDGNQIIHSTLNDGDCIRIGASKFHFFQETVSEKHNFTDVFADVYTLRGPDNPSRTFPTYNATMQGFIRLARPWVLHRISLLMLFLKRDAKETTEMCILRLATSCVSARRGNLHIVLEGPLDATIGLGGAFLPAEVQDRRTALCGPNSSLEEELVPEPSSNKNENIPDGENLIHRSREPYLYIPIGSEGHIYLEDPSERNLFDEDDIESVKEIIKVGLSLLGGAAGEKTKL